MKRTSKMMGHLYKPFDKNPRKYFALSLNNSNGDLTWSVSDQVLTCDVAGYPAGSITVDLTAYTISSLATYLNGLGKGFVAVVQPGVDGGIGAIALMDDAHDVANDSNGDHLYAFSDLTWAFMDAYAKEIEDLAKQQPNALMQLRIDQSEGEFTDIWLNQVLNSLRNDGETDGQAIDRIISTVTLVKSNNYALENLVFKQTGIDVQIVDIDWFTGDESMYTYGGPYWNAGMTTNNAHSRLYPAWNADPAVVTAYALTLSQSGIPSFGGASNDNPLLNAFAVIFAIEPSMDDYNRVMTVVNKARAGGTVALGYYGATSPYTPFP